jgi:hypothetical protein
MYMCGLSNYALRSILSSYNSINKRNIYISNIDRMEKYQLIFHIKTISNLFPSSEVVIENKYITTE